ncbi:hypothetical protein GF406_14120 [candidate division KSB1 bacterium]|nr:hypothetical protein [candidate division KSB1 bacterium]
MKWLSILIMLSLLTMGCDVDQGLEPTQSGFSGTVHFSAPWPEETDQVLVVASKVFPPSSLEDLVLGEPLPLNVDSVQYTLYTNPLDFAAVGVVWKQKNQPWDVTNIIGIYFSGNDKFSPSPVVIPDRQAMITDIDINADLSRAKFAVSSAIKGTISTEGQWPETAQSVLIIASKNILPTGLLDIQFSPPIEPGFESTEYTFTVQPGTYRLIAMLLLEENVPLGVESIKGFYRSNPASPFPGSVTVASDSSVVDNIDMILDFSEL